MKLSKRIFCLALAALLMACITMPAYAAENDCVQGIGFVTATTLRLRKEPNTTSSTLATASKNECVVLLEKSGEWYRVNYNLKEGYMHSSYLQTAEGYASSLKAATTIYNDGVRIFITLGKLKAAIADNPQGPVATLSMNNLYIETATELVTVFTLLKDAVAKGGKENMLTGAERSQTLWMLSDKLHVLSRKFQQLYLSIRYYTMTDVWNRATAGIIDHSYGELAVQSFRRWRRAAKVVTP